MGERNWEKVQFYQELLMKMVVKGNYPFYELIIEGGLTEEEMNAVFRLCDELQQKYEEQRELGFVHFTHLLVHFAGMLPINLNVEKTMDALKAQNVYPELMDVLKAAHKRIKLEN